MVSSISSQLLYGRPITGFGTRRRVVSHKKLPTHVIVPVSAITGLRRRRTVRPRVAHHAVHHAGSYKITGSGYRRKPRAMLTHRRKTVGGYKRRTVSHRAPRRTLGLGTRRHTVHKRRLILI